MIGWTEICLPANPVYVNRAMQTTYVKGHPVRFDICSMEYIVWLNTSEYFGDKVAMKNEAEAVKEILDTLE
jgi:hypothetical protein